jgi:hypothetical protein
MTPWDAMGIHDDLAWAAAGSVLYGVDGPQHARVFFMRNTGHLQPCHSAGARTLPVSRNVE